MTNNSLLIYILMGVFFINPFRSFSQEEQTVPDGTTGELLTVPVVDSTGKATNLKDNEINTRVSTIKVGLGYIGDYAYYMQNAVFKTQMDSANLEMKSQFKTRDARILGSGKFNTKRELMWKFAFMYEGASDEWLVRETGLTIGVPELAGRLFIGRTKEGFSMIKVMNGHSPWGVERQAALDVIPIMADGIKYFGYLPKPRIFLNLGYFNDVISKGQGFSTFAWQYVARVGFLPYYNQKEQKVVHLGFNFRYAKPLDDQIGLKSRPESNPSPFIINTGTFGAEHSMHLGGEAYYSTGRLGISSEVVVHDFYSSEAGDHQFLGGTFDFTYLFTDTKRPYNTNSSLFGFVPVNHSITKGGWGEWELALRYSWFDLNDRDIQGGKMWKFTSMLNWYMTKVTRMEFIYGYSVLDRFNLTGTLQILQARIQFTLL